MEPEPSDGQLVERAAAGDAAAWRTLVERHSQRLWAIARFFGLSRERADDVVQTCWLRLLDNLPRLRDPEAVGPWLRKVAKNESLRIGKVEAHTVHPPDDQVFDRLQRSEAVAERPEERVVASDDRVRLVRAFAKLSEPCRQSLRLFFSVERMSYEQIAEELRRPLGSLGPTRSRCLDLLRRAFDRERSTIGGARRSGIHGD